MLAQIRPAIVLLVLFSALTGLVYPLAITGVAQLALAKRANGSLVYIDGKPVGSSLIGQNFASDKYFPSLDAPYNAANSTGSNLGPTSQKLIDRITADVKAKHDAGWSGPIPADAVTTSASGLDPDISPTNALMQVPAVAKARGLSEDAVRALVQSHIKGRLAGVFGEPRVNVLKLNMALDATK
jgi:K+-transporting ATPase ATPase C chain